MALLRSITFLFVFAVGMSATAQEAKHGGEITKVTAESRSEAVVMLCRTDNSAIGNCLLGRPAQTLGMPCACGSAINQRFANGKLELSEQHSLVCDTGTVKCIHEVREGARAGEACDCKSFKNTVQGTLRHPVNGDTENMVGTN